MMKPALPTRKRTAPVSACDGNVATINMKLYNRRADRKTKAETSLLGCEKRLKNLVFSRWRQPATTIVNVHFDAAIVGPCGADRDSPPGRRHIFRCVHRIHQKVEQCLLQLHGVTARCRQVVSIIEAHGHPTIDQLAVQELQGRRNELVHIDRFVFDFAFLQHDGGSDGTLSEEFESV